MRQRVPHGVLVLGQHCGSPTQEQHFAAVGAEVKHRPLLRLRSGERQRRAARLPIPHAGDSRAIGGQPAAIRENGQLEHRIRLRLQGTNYSTRSQFVESYFTFGVTRHHTVAIRRNCDRQNRLVGQIAEPLATGDFPDMPISSRSHEILPVGAEGETVADILLVLNGEFANFLASGRIPQANALVQANGQNLPIWREGRWRTGVCSAVGAKEIAQLFSGRRIAQANRLTDASDHQVAAVGTDGQRCDPVVPRRAAQGAGCIGRREIGRSRTRVGDQLAIAAERRGEEVVGGGDSTAGCRVRTTWPVAVSRRMAPPSREPVSKYLPSALNDTVDTVA